MSTYPEISRNKIFITGGAGFIGSILVGKLVQDNQVVVFDNMTRDALAGKEYKHHPNLTVVKGDILDFEAVARHMAGANLVVHAAAIAGIDTVIELPVKTMEVNMVGSANVLRAAASLKACDRVLCFSTSEVFGPRAYGAHETNETVIGAVGEARWTYAVSKLAEEHLAKAYHMETGLPTTVVRPFNVYGPGQVGEGALKIFVERALRNETIYIHGSGTQIRAWCYIDDMVTATLKALVHPQAVGESFNIGNATSSISIFGLANTVVRILGSKSPVEFSGRMMADIELRVPDVEKARRLIGFEANVALDEGILRTAEYYKGLLPA